MFLSSNDNIFEHCHEASLASWDQSEFTWLFGIPTAAVPAVGRSGLPRRYSATREHEPLGAVARDSPSQRELLRAGGSPWCVMAGSTLTGTLALSQANPRSARTQLGLV